MRLLLQKLTVFLFIEFGCSRRDSFYPFISSLTIVNDNESLFSFFVFNCHNLPSMVPSQSKVFRSSRSAVRDSTGLSLGSSHPIRRGPKPLLSSRNISSVEGNGKWGGGCKSIFVGFNEVLTVLMDKLHQIKYHKVTYQGDKLVGMRKKEKKLQRLTRNINRHIVIDSNQFSQPVGSYWIRSQDIVRWAEVHFQLAHAQQCFVSWLDK